MDITKRLQQEYEYRAEQAEHDRQAWIDAFPNDRSKQLIHDLDLTKPLSVSDHGHDLGGGLFPANPSELLGKSYKIRTDYESLVRSMEGKFQRHLEITSYALPRLIGLRLKELNDEIDWLVSIGGVAHNPDDDRAPFVKTPGYVPPKWTPWELDDIRAIYAVGQDIAWMQNRNFDAVVMELQKALAQDDTPELRASVFRSEIMKAPVVPNVVGIDLETTGLSPIRNWVIDAGLEYIDLDTDNEPFDSYRSHYGVSSKRYELGNPTEFVSQINITELKDVEPLETDHEAQEFLLSALTSRPFVAHNARFENSFFMQNIEGYAEARRAGRIRIIDTQKLSRRLDPREEEGNSLEAYAHRWNGLEASEQERHLGLEDTHIMLLAMRNHLRSVGLIKKEDQ
jgi:DNA polymerase III epsilon subunit-like protein